MATPLGKTLFARLWQHINGIVDATVQGSRNFATGIKVRLGFGSSGAGNEDVERQSRSPPQTQTYISTKRKFPMKPATPTTADTPSPQQTLKPQKYTAPAAAAEEPIPKPTLKSDLETRRRKCRHHRHRSATAAREEEEAEREHCTRENLDAVDEIEAHGTRVRDFATGYDSTIPIKRGWEAYHS